jgi:hypothetical protein
MTIEEKFAKEMGEYYTPIEHPDGHQTLPLFIHYPELEETNLWVIAHDGWLVRKCSPETSSSRYYHVLFRKQ